MDEIECTNCRWTGDSTMLVTTASDDTPVAECKFDHCPDCGGTEFEDLDD